MLGGHRDHYKPAAGVVPPLNLNTTINNNTTTPTTAPTTTTTTTNNITTNNNNNNITTTTTTKNVPESTTNNNTNNLDRSPSGSLGSPTNPLRSSDGNIASSSSNPTSPPLTPHTPHTPHHNIIKAALTTNATSLNANATFTTIDATLPNTTTGLTHAINATLTTNSTLKVPTHHRDSVSSTSSSGSSRTTEPPPSPLVPPRSPRLTSPREPRSPPLHTAPTVPAYVGHKQHSFTEVHFTKPTFCSLSSCQGFIWGLTKQGYSCTSCHNSVHKRCMPIAFENDVCPGRHLNEEKLKKMTLKKKLKHVNTYLEQLFAVPAIPFADDFHLFLEIVSSDFQGIQSNIPNLFESFKNKELCREGIMCLVEELPTTDEPSLYFYISMLEVLATCDANKLNIVKTGAVGHILARLTGESPALTTVIPSLSLFEALFLHRPTLQEILFQASVNPTNDPSYCFRAFRQFPGKPKNSFLETAKYRMRNTFPAFRPPLPIYLPLMKDPVEATGALVDDTAVGGSLEFAARKMSPAGIQHMINRLMALSKMELISRDDSSMAKLAKILGSAYKEEGIQQYVEKSGGHELLVKAAMKQLVQLHTEIAESEVRFDYDGLVYDSPLCRVFIGTYNKQRVAIKVFSVDSLGFDLQNFNKEIALMSIVSGQNVVKCHGVKTKGDSPFVVMEYFSNGSLNDFITLNPKEIPLRTKVYLMLGAANGIRFLHEKSIIHRDIKTQNFMVAEEFLNCKVIDFGVSRVDALMNAKKTIVGTPVFMAPEVMHDQQYTFSADSYSFALVMWEMITKNTPYYDINPLRVADHILNHRPAVPPDCDPLLARIMKACWAHEPSLRPGFTQIIDMLSYFTFPLGVKTQRKFLPDRRNSIFGTQTTTSEDIVDFAHLYLVLEPATYKHLFMFLDKHNRVAIRETCKYWKEVVDEIDRKIAKTGR